MRYNILINSKNNVGGDNPSNYKYNFNFSSFQEGDYELGFNFNTNGLKTVQATPVYTGTSTTATFSSNTLSITNTSLNYEYALTNGAPYTVSTSSFASVSYQPFNAFNNTTAAWWGSGAFSYDVSGIQQNNILTIVDNINKYGEWLQIKLPYLLKLNSFSIEHIYRPDWGKVKDFILVGSNDGITWNTITENSITIFSNSYVSTFTLGNNIFYSYFRIIVKNIVYGTTGGSGIPSSATIPYLRLYGETYPVNNATPLQIELEGLGATQKSYTTTTLTAAKSSNLIGTIPLSNSLYYNSSYKFNNLVNVLSKPLSHEITINLKKSNGELFNIGEDYVMVLSFLKK